MTVIQFPKLNNLEWLRLIFAWQVVLVHAGEHLKLRPALGLKKKSLHRL